VLHQIGAGALGPVFRAYDPGQDKLAAVKLLRLDLAPERVHKLVREFERLIAADLTHVAIAAPIATGISGVSAYLAQDFVAADSLDTVLREHGPAPVAEAVRVVTQLAGALDYAAVVNILHGALHPRDVLISPDDTRITGLGVTRALERVGYQAPVRRPYTAPERAAGREWDRRADIFSLAALTHELLWGRRITATGAEAAAALTDLPGARLDALRAVFARALAADPAKRFVTALEFADALRRSFSVQSTTVDVRPADDRRLPTADPLLPLYGSEADDPEAPPALARAAGDVDTAPQNTPLERGDLESGDIDGTGEDDLDLRKAEAARFEGVEVAPSVVDPQIAVITPAAIPEPKAAAVTEHAAPAVAAAAAAVPEPVLSRAPASHEVLFEQRDPARSAVWPLSMALVVGIALGFAAGYWRGNAARERLQAGVADAPAAREFTDNDLRLKADAGREADTEVRLKADATGGSGATGGASATGGAAAPVSAPAPVAAAPVPPSPAAPPKPSAAAGAPVSTGRLTISTTPAGARVLVDGRDAGKTPVTVRNLPRGTHTVRVTREGYTPLERRVSVTAARPNPSLALRLERAAPPPAPTAAQRMAAPLVIESRPDGAAVFLDGKRIGTTPLSVAAVPVGSHVVRLELSGYTPWSYAVRVAAGEKNRVAASLEPVKP
jgi:hypothetical protein